jgi:hypothetical protein
LPAAVWNTRVSTLSCSDLFRASLFIGVMEAIAE